MRRDWVKTSIFQEKYDNKNEILLVYKTTKGVIFRGYREIDLLEMINR